MMQATAINRPLLGVPWKPLLLALGTLTTLTLYILAWAFPTFPGDEGALMRFQALRSGWLDGTAIWFENIGLLSVFMPAAAALMGFLVLAQCR